MANRGGAERYIVSLRDALREKHDDVMLVACSGPETTPTCDDRVFGSSFPPAQAFLQIANPAAKARLRSIVRSFKPDVALVSQFAYHFSPSVFAPLAGIPMVVTMMDYKAICPLGTRLLPNGSPCVERAGASCMSNRCVSVPHWMRDLPRYALIRKGLAGATRIVCPSDWMRRQFSSAGIDAEHVRFGVSNPSESFRHSPASHPKFVYCGRLSSEKGVALLVRAFAKFVADVPHASLSIVGDGPLRHTIERLVAKLGVSRAVTLTGWVSSERVDNELSDAWALVAPSIWAEPFGLAVVEAIVRGVPALVSDSGAFLETVEPNVSGLVFESGNEAALVQALRKIAMRTIFPSGAIDNAALARVRQTLSLDGHVDRMRSIFSDVTGEERAYA
jgi:glycosyltransferase involved in cell wall biosynthesis